jgi:peptide-methionine (R)-S-oxide reductase
MGEKIVKSDDEWKKELDPQAFEVLRQHGTERPFTGKLLDNHEHGVYVCAGCGLELFASDTKFESGSGWPSFYAPLDKDHVATTTDQSHGMARVEVHCPRCGGHLGHVFDDGPRPTGQRYCINSCSLKFEKK